MPRRLQVQVDQDIGFTVTRQTRSWFAGGGWSDAGVVYQYTPGSGASVTIDRVIDLGSLFSFQSHRLKLSLDSPANARMRLDGVQSTETSNLITVPVSIYDQYMPEVLATAEPDNDHIFYSTNKGIYVRKNALVCREIGTGGSLTETGTADWTAIYEPGERERTVYKHFDTREVCTDCNAAQNGSRYDVMGFTLSGQLKLARDVDLNVAPVWETLPNFPDVSLIRAMESERGFWVASENGLMGIRFDSTGSLQIEVDRRLFIRGRIPQVTDLYELIDVPEVGDQRLLIATREGFLF